MTTTLAHPFRIDAAGRAVETNWTISSLTPFTWASGDEIVGSEVA